MRRPRRTLSKAPSQIDFYLQRVPGEVTFALVLLLCLALPSEIPGYLCGYLGVRLRTYVAALALAELPYAFGAVLLGDGVVNRQVGGLLAFGLIGAALSAYALWLLHKRLEQPREPRDWRAARSSATPPASLPPDQRLHCPAPMSTDTLLLALLGVALVFLNGFFVAAEFAIVKLRRTQADELGKSHGCAAGCCEPFAPIWTPTCPPASSASRSHRSASAGSASQPSPGCSSPCCCPSASDDPQVLHSIAFAVAFAFISFLHIVLGELAPKSIAIRRAEAVSLNTALPLYVFYWVMYPFIYVLNGAANVIVRRLGVELATEGDAVHSVDELRSVLRASHRHGEIGSVETQILVHGLELGELTVGDLMRPLSELVWLSADTTIGDVLAEVRSTRFTRYPFRDPETGRFTGLLHIKDLVAAEERLRDIHDLRPYLRRIPYFDENAPLLKVLKAFRTGDPHFGIVTDERGTEIGFVTFEHVIEALFGPVEDEFAKKSPSWQLAGDGSVSGAGSLSLLSLEDAIGRPTPDLGVNSVGGLVQEQLGRLPRPGERVRFPHFEVEVLEMAGPRIELVRVRPLDPPSPDGD